MTVFKPRALEYLEYIVRYGSLRRAAVRLGVDPSALSRQIKALEADLDTQLLIRQATSLVLTPAGELVLRHYRNQCAAERATLSQLRELANLERGSVRIAVGEGFIADLISAPLQNFLTTYPGLEIEVHMAGLRDAISLLQEDIVDIALLYAPPFDPQLISHVDRHQPLDLIMPSDHPLAIESAPLSFTHIAEHPLALINDHTGMGKLVDMALYQAHSSLAPRMKTNSVAVLKNFVRSGLGVTFMPELTVLEEIREGSIVVRAVEAEILHNARTRIVSHDKRPLTVAAQAFITYLARNMRFFSADAPRILNEQALHKTQHPLT